MDAGKFAKITTVVKLRSNLMIEKLVKNVFTKSRIDNRLKGAQNVW